MNEYDNSDVIELTKKDFNNKTLINTKLKNKNGIIKFYAPWCGYCKNMVKDLKFLATGLKNKDFFIAAVNTEANNELSTKFNITGIPTLYMYNQDGNLSLYNGNKDIESLLESICEFTSKKLCCKKDSNNISC